MGHSRPGTRQRFAHRLNAATEAWWWGVSFMLVGRKSYGHADSLNKAEAAFQIEFKRWEKEHG